MSTRYCKDEATSLVVSGTALLPQRHRVKEYVTSGTAANSQLDDVELGARAQRMSEQVIPWRGSLLTSAVSGGNARRVTWMTQNTPVSDLRQTRGDILVQRLQSVKPMQVPMISRLPQITEEVPGAAWTKDGSDAPSEPLIDSYQSSDTNRSTRIRRLMKRIDGVDMLQWKELTTRHARDDHPAVTLSESRSTRKGVGSFSFGVDIAAFESIRCSDSSGTTVDNKMNTAVDLQDAIILRNRQEIRPYWSPPREGQYTSETPAQCSTITTTTSKNVHWNEAELTTLLGNLNRQSSGNSAQQLVNWTSLDRHLKQRQLSTCTTPLSSCRPYIIVSATKGNRSTDSSNKVVTSTQLICPFDDIISVQNNRSKTTSSSVRSYSDLKRRNADFDRRKSVNFTTTIS